MTNTDVYICLKKVLLFLIKLLFNVKIIFIIMINDFFYNDNISKFFIMSV